MTTKTFAELGLDKWLIKQLKLLRIVKPTPIQLNCIPPILSGKDCLGIAKTGSGKTAAFALPILHKWSHDPFGIYALILTPTRELAFQIKDHFDALGKPHNLQVAVITGGRDMVEQGAKLSDRPHIVIATPGRLADHLQSCDTFSLDKIKFLVLDESDRLLDDGFGEQLGVILDRVNPKRQTLFFSATKTDTFQELLSLSKVPPFTWEEQSETLTVEHLVQRYMYVPADMKDAYLIHALDRFCRDNPRSSVIIFTNKCIAAQCLSMVLTDLGFEHVLLHAAMKQRLRLAALAKFKSSQTRILVTTDLASRGLDIPMVDLIINENVPWKPKTYVHRVGRTARAGRRGLSITMITTFDLKQVKPIEDFTKVKMQEHPANEQEVLKIFPEVLIAKTEAKIRLEYGDFGAQQERHKAMKRKLRDEEEGENGMSASSGSRLSAKPREDHSSSQDSGTASGEDVVPAKKKPRRDKSSKKIKSSSGEGEVEETPRPEKLKKKKKKMFELSDEEEVVVRKKDKADKLRRKKMMDVTDEERKVRKKAKKASKEKRLES